MIPKNNVHETCKVIFTSFKDLHLHHIEGMWLAVWDVGHCVLTGILIYLGTIDVDRSDEQLQLSAGWPDVTIYTDR